MCRDDSCPAHGVCLLHKGYGVAAILFAAICVSYFSAASLIAETPSELRIGRAGHAFDHLGGIGLQAEAAAASGSTIIYASGVGEAGYQGLPPQNEFATLRKNVGEYSRRAKELGIELNIGYLCADFDHQA